MSSSPRVADAAVLSSKSDLDGTLPRRGRVGDDTVQQATARLRRSLRQTRRDPSHPARLRRVGAARCRGAMARARGRRSEEASPRRLRPFERPRAPVARRPGMSGRISVEEEGALGWLIFDHESRRNAITAEMWRAIPGAARELDEDPDIRVVILRGA